MFDDMKGANRGARAPEDSSGKFSLRKFFRLSWILVVIVALVIAGIFYLRWQESRDIAEKAAEQQRRNARAVVEGLGGSSFQIMSFYASPGVIHRGDSAELCYGVANAASVAIDPKPSEGIWPSVGRCVSISPRKSTTYTLTAVDAKGQKKTQSLTLEVQ